MSRPTILFACVHNSGRSVAAHVLARHYANGRVEVRSAGSQPADAVNPVVAEVLADRGLPLAGHSPTHLTAELVRHSDIVVTMGCGESCPVFPGKRYEDWPVADPAGQPKAAVQAIVDDIDLRVRDLIRRTLRLPGSDEDLAAERKEAAGQEAP